MIGDGFHNLSILVVGGVVVDSYWEGEVKRISPEAPIPVVDIQKEFHRAGGAANVALNIARLGGSVRLVSAVGNDDSANKLREILDEAGVKLDFIVHEGLTTNKKLRVISQDQQLIYLDFGDKFSSVNKAPLLDKYMAQLPSCQVVIITDNDGGTLFSIIPALIDAAKRAGKIVLVDPKRTDFNLYKEANYITPNFKEFTDVVGACCDEEVIIGKATKLMEELHLDGFLLTRGAQGMSLIRADSAPVTIPAQECEVIDVTGAGDTAMAVMALGLAAELDPATCMQYANAAAAVVVAKMGTATLSCQELQSAISKGAKPTKGILTKELLRMEIEAAHLRGEKVVMTNGCFDILHAGHVVNLKAASAMGDRLVVAVNDDDSVRRLKGETRPIVPLIERMEILEALEPVDWVVSFREDTPAELITYLSPDILSKGCEYKISEVVGADHVIASGGEVRLIQNWRPECSTSKLIERIQRS